MISRRHLIAAALLPLVPRVGFAQPTPACGRPSPAQTPGPFYKPSTPLRSSFLPKDYSGQKLRVAGVVLARDCKPVANAILDFWHADEFGDYDNQGFRYRGHQFTAAQGRYRLETILPAEYPGRARHIHVKVGPRGGRLLTTQLYFPASFGHPRDGLYTPVLEMRMPKSDQGLFDFVIDA